MGLKKFDKEEAKVLEEAEIQKAKDDENKIESVINENSKEEEELKNLPLDEKQKLVTDKINAARAEYFDYTKRQKRINTIISASVVVAMIACVVLIFAFGKTYNWISYLCLGVMVVALIGTFSATHFIKKKLSAKAEDYISILYKLVNEYLYCGEEFSNLQVKSNGQMKDELFTEARFYKNIKGTKSRNLVSVVYKDSILGSADLAGNVLVKNRLSPMFLGKYYDYKSSYNQEGCRILMQIKGGNLSRPVDDTDDLKLVEGNDRYCIYTNDEHWRKTLTAKVIKDITELKIDKTLIDVIISIRPGKVNIGIDYVDEFMNIPVDHEFDFNVVKRTEHDLKKVITILDDLN